MLKLITIAILALSLAACENAKPGDANAPTDLRPTGKLAKFSYRQDFGPEADALAYEITRYNDALDIYEIRLVQIGTLKLVAEKISFLLTDKGGDIGRFVDHLMNEGVPSAITPITCSPGAMCAAMMRAPPPTTAIPLSAPGPAPQPLCIPNEIYVATDYWSQYDVIRLERLNAAIRARALEILSSGHLVQPPVGTQPIDQWLYCNGVSQLCESPGGIVTAPPEEVPGGSPGQPPMTDPEGGMPGPRPLPPVPYCADPHGIPGNPTPMPMPLPPERF